MSAQRIDYEVPGDEAGVTLRALAARLAGEAGHLAAARGGAWLGQRRLLDPEEALPAGATLTLRLPPPAGYAEVTIAEGDVAYEDQWLIAVHKRMGWYVGATPWDREGNVLAALGRYLGARDGGAPPLHLAHQLDRDTTGVLLASKSPDANARLQAAFAGGQVAKEYRCLCLGVPQWSALELRTGHGRAAGGRWRVYPLESVGQELPQGGGRVKEARSGFVLELPLRGAALLRATPHTGRTHQIRLHLAHAGHPLLGDARYGGPQVFAGAELPGHMLHAASLRLAHPITGGELLIESPLPAFFAGLLAPAGP